VRCPLRNPEFIDVATLGTWKQRRPYAFVRKLKCKRGSEEVDKLV